MVYDVSIYSYGLMLLQANLMFGHLAAQVEVTVVVPVEAFVGNWSDVSSWFL